MNIYLHELNMNRKSILTWACSLAAFGMVVLILYPVFTKDTEAFISLLSGFPEPLKKAFGVHVESIANFSGFYSFLFIYLMLCGAIQGAILGISMLSREINAKTADFLLSKPCTRTKILTFKLFAALTAAGITYFAYLTFSLLLIWITGPKGYSFMPFFLVSLSLLFIQIIFIILGLVLSLIVRKIKSVLGAALPLALIFFFIQIIGDVSDEEKVSYFTPFKYFDAHYIAANEAYDAKFLPMAAGIVILGLIFSYIAYNRKDIHAV